MKISISNKPRDERASLADIRALLGGDMEAFEQGLRRALSRQEGYLTDAEYQMYARGKKLRPMLLLLSARMCSDPGAPLPERVAEGAVAVEMLHAASLIHDDIIDHADRRRGLPSVPAQRGVGTAVLVGDLQFLQSIRGFVDTIRVEKDMGLVRMVLDTAFDICRGELDELRADPFADVKVLRRQYMETIDRKTAILFGLCCESGVILAGGEAEDARRAGFYGRRLGRAFQIMDDIFDVTRSDRKAGKGRCADLKNRRLSLPVLDAMEALGEHCMVSRMIRDAAVLPDEKAVDRAADEILQSGALLRSYGEARRQALDALEYLRFFPGNPYRKALENLAYTVVDRA